MPSHDFDFILFLIYLIIIIIYLIQLLLSYLEVASYVVLMFRPGTVLTPSNVLTSPASPLAPKGTSRVIRNDEADGLVPDEVESSYRLISISLGCTSGNTNAA